MLPPPLLPSLLRTGSATPILHQTHSYTLGLGSSLNPKLASQPDQLLALQHLFKRGGGPSHSPHAKWSEAAVPPPQSPEPIHTLSLTHSSFKTHKSAWRTCYVSVSLLPISCSDSGLSFLSLSLPPDLPSLTWSQHPRRRPLNIPTQHLPSSPWQPPLPPWCSGT